MATSIGGAFSSSRLRSPFPPKYHHGVLSSSSPLLLLFPLLFWSSSSFAAALVKRAMEKIKMGNTTESAPAANQDTTRRGEVMEGRLTRMAGLMKCLVELLCVYWVLFEEYWDPKGRTQETLVESLKMRCNFGAARVTSSATDAGCTFIGMNPAELYFHQEVLELPGMPHGNRVRRRERVFFVVQTTIVLVPR